MLQRVRFTGESPNTNFKTVRYGRVKLTRELIFNPLNQLSHILPLDNYQTPQQIHFY